MSRVHSRRRTGFVPMRAEITAGEPESQQSLPRLFNEPRYRAAYHRCAGFIDGFLAFAPPELATVMGALPLSSEDCEEPPARVRAFNVLIATALLFREVDHDHVIVHADGGVLGASPDGHRYSEFQIAAYLGEPVDLGAIERAKSDVRVHRLFPRWLMVWATMRELFASYAVEPDGRGWAWGCCLGMRVMRKLDGRSIFSCIMIPDAELRRTQDTSAVEVGIQGC